VLLGGIAKRERREKKVFWRKIFLIFEKVKKFFLSYVTGRKDF